MANDNNELKNNAPCEEKQEARELTSEEIAQVSGGGVRPARTSQHVIKPVVVETAAVLKPWIHPSK